MGTASRPRLEFARAQSAHRVDDDVRGMIPDRARHRAQIDLHASGRLVVCQQNAGDLVFSVSAQPRSRPASKGCVLFPVLVLFCPVICRERADSQVLG